jgi:hypothetical protein
MPFRFRYLRVVAGVTLLSAAAIPSHAQAPDQQHVVPLDQLHKDAAGPAQTRQADEAAVKQILATEQGQKALKSANWDLQRVDKAVSQLSDEDLARLAEKSRQAQKDFAAGSIGDHELIIILLVIVLVLIIIAATR